MRSYRFRTVVCLLIGAWGISEAQPGGARRQPGEVGTGLVYYESINSPSTLPGRSRVDVVYRIDLSFFIAVRDEASPLSPQFVREGEVQIELVDSTGQVAARKTDRFSKPGGSSQPPPSTSWYEAAVTFDLVPGSYEILMTIEDLESSRSFIESHRKIRAADFPPGETIVAAPFFVDDTEPTGILYPQNIGGGIRFGDPATMVVVVANDPDSSSPGVLLSSWQLDSEGIDTVLIIPETAVEPERYAGSVLGGPSGDRPGYSLEPSDVAHSIYLIPFQSGLLGQGRTILEFTIGNQPPKKTVFEVVWPDMPRSLRDPEYALDALRYVTGKDEWDSLRSGTDEGLRKNLEGFWALRDGTPETAYNEVMTEYYRRVDHSAITFGTLREPDGSRTDQGRIYILYGKPTRAERKLDPSGFIEIWSYQDARKQFVFIDESRKGEYVLTSTRPL